VYGMLNINISLLESKVAPESYILCLPLTYFKMQAGGVLGAALEGWMTKRSKKGDRVTSAKKRWFMLKHSILYYFSSKTSGTPQGMIDLEYMIATDDATKPQDICLSNAVPVVDYPYSPQYFLSVDENKAKKEWLRHFRRQTVNGAPHVVFGISLTQLWERKFSPDVSIILEDLIQYMDAFGMSTVGIFRETGPASVVESLRDEYDRGIRPDLMTNKPDVLCVAAILKGYLREMPEPVLTYSLYPEFIKAKTNVEKLKELILQLPVAHQLALKILLPFLYRVSQHSASHKMDVQNIAVVFTPNLLKPKEDEKLMSESSIANAIVMCMIENHQHFQYKRSNDVKTE